jgi:steroid 5-alpha reductase family enzyme
VFLTLSCALAAMTSVTRVPLGGSAALGTAVWLAGFAIEVVADRQKSRFRADPGNRDRFITTGLWAWSRHPNYFGEITSWVGIALIAWPALAGWQLATLISPVFVFVLLTRVSGIPLLESRAREKWGHDPDYRAYRARTPVLLPRPPVSA